MEDLKEKYLKDGNIVVLRSGEEYIVFRGVLFRDGQNHCIDRFDNNLNAINCKIQYDIVIVKNGTGNVLWERENIDKKYTLGKGFVFSTLSNYLRVPMEYIVLDLELSEDTSITIKY